MNEMQTYSSFTVVNCWFQEVEGNLSAKNSVIIHKTLEELKPESWSERMFRVFTVTVSTATIQAIKYIDV